MNGVAHRLAALSPAALLPWACGVLVVARLAVIAIAYPAGDGDRLWQYWLGERILREHAIPRALGAETFSAAGAPWVPQEWLFSTLLAWTIDRGLPWIVPLACALIVGSALVLTALRCRKRGLHATRTSVAILLCGIATVQSFGVRAQVVAWAGSALVLWLLEAEGPGVWLVVPVTAVWANLHASAYLAPAIALLLAGAAVVRDGAWSRSARTLSAVGAASALATLCTPLGLALPRYVAMLLSSPIRAAIAEWGATSIGAVAFTAGALPLLLMLVAFGVRSPVRDRIVAVVFTVFLFAAVRNVPIFAFAIAPIALAALPCGPSRPADAFFARIAAWITVVAAVAAAAVIAALTWNAASGAAAMLPDRTRAVLLLRARSEPRVFCEDFAWCSIFLGRQPSATVFMDGRGDPYPLAVWNAYLRVLHGNVGWDAVLARYRVDAVLVRPDGALESLLRTQPRLWRMIASDAVSRLYVRPALLERPRSPQR